jgi:hypothetical protein
VVQRSHSAGAPAIRADPPILEAHSLAPASVNPANAGSPWRGGDLSIRSVAAQPQVPGYFCRPSCALNAHGVRCVTMDREEHVRCDAWPAERKCVSRGWCGMKPVNTTRCIAWAAKKLSALLSSLLPAMVQVRRTIKLIRNLLLPAPGGERSQRFAAGNAPRPNRQPSRGRTSTGIANFRNCGTSPFRVSGSPDHSERPTLQLHGPSGCGGLNPGTCGSTRRKREPIRTAVRCNSWPVTKSWTL